MLKIKVPEGMRVSVALGCWVGRPPFGYEVPKGQAKRTQKLVAVKADARTVVRIFTRYAEGATFAAIAQELQAAGVAGPFTRFKDLGEHRVSSGRWRSCTVRRILQNVAYTGAVVGHGLHVEDAHEAIVDAKLWAAVRARIGSGRKKQPKQHASNPQPYMLTGLLTCATCGGAVVGGGGVDKRLPDPFRYQIYVCPNSSKREAHTCEGRTLGVNQRWLEATVCEHVGAQIAQAVKSGALAKALDRALGTRSDAREPRAELEAQRDALQAKHSNVLDAIADGTVTKGQAKAKLGELETALATVERELTAVRLVPKRSELIAERDRLLKLAANLPALLAKATPTERRELLAAWVQEIRLDKVARTGVIAVRPIPAGGHLYRNSELCPTT